MSASHTNKGGARYRYYVSQAILQNRPAGSIGRVPATEIEALVIEAVRDHLRDSGIAPSSIPDDAHKLIERHVERVTLTSRNVELQLRSRGEAAAAIDADEAATVAAQPNGGLTIPWTHSDPTAIKGVVYVPSHNTPMTPSRRDALLIAIAKARAWVEDLAHGRAASFAAIARREGKAERHVRLLAPLAFVSPRIVAAILDGTAPERLTASALARALPWLWAEQERQVGIEAPALTGGC